MNCPYCHSNNIEKNIETRTEIETKEKGFGWCKGIIGFLIYWPLIICGFCGSGKNKTKTITTHRTVFLCRNCGKTF